MIHGGQQILNPFHVWICTALSSPNPRFWTVYYNSKLGLDNSLAFKYTKIAICIASIATWCCILTSHNFNSIKCIYNCPCSSCFSNGDMEKFSMVTVARAHGVSSCLSSCLRSHFPTWLRLRSNQTVMRGPREDSLGSAFFIMIWSWGFSSWRARSAAISCRSPEPEPELWSGDKKYASSASSREYILFDGLAPRLSHVSHVMPEPEPAEVRSC